MSVSVETYKRVALEDDDAVWELDCGRLRRKPDMTLAHDSSLVVLATRLVKQLDEAEHVVSTNTVKLRITPTTYYVPDLCVVPQAVRRRALIGHERDFGVYDEPMPLVVEVWSPSTGDYDVEVKLREYQRRGDLEIWQVHPYERTLTAWRRQPDGSYTETRYGEDAVVEPVALPGVRIVLATLFA